MKKSTIMHTIILITTIITMKMQYAEKMEPVQFRTFLDNVFISNVTFTSNKTWISHLDASPSHRILLKILHATSNAQPPIYLHFICCTVMQRIREAVAVKPTLKSLRNEISFQKGRFWRATLSRSGAYRRSEGDFFSPYVWVYHPCA